MACLWPETQVDYEIMNCPYKSRLTEGAAVLVTNSSVAQEIRELCYSVRA